jgi:GntR family transcriptional repressor for pyruvate dehydrogenase complex
MSSPSPHKKLYQKVAQAVGEAIRNGEFGPGARIPSERELAERFGVSRPTLREAMIALEIQGFVEVRHGSGIHVTAAAPKVEGGADLDIGPFELTEARLVVEGEACALAAVSIEDAEVAELEILLEAMTRDAPPPRTLGAAPTEGEQADRRFHMLIAQASRNSAIASAVELLWDMRYRSPLCVEMLARAYDAGDRPRIDEHRQIVDALAARDPRAARNAMRLHLSRVIEGLLAATEGDAVRRARAEAAARREIYARRASV